MVRVAGAVNAAIAAFGPTAAMRSPAIAMESAILELRSSVMILPFRSTKSAGRCGRRAVAIEVPMAAFRKSRRLTVLSCTMPLPGQPLVDELLHAVALRLAGHDISLRIDVETVYMEELARLAPGSADVADLLERLAIQNRDAFVRAVGDVHETLLRIGRQRHAECRARPLRFTLDEPFFEEFAVQGERLDAVVRAICHIDDAVVGDLNAVRRVELLRSSAGHLARLRGLVLRLVAVGAPVALVGAGVGVEHDDAAVAVAVGNKHLVGLVIHGDACRPAQVRCVVAVDGHATLADLEQKLSVPGELEDLAVAVAVTGEPDIVPGVNGDAVLAAPGTSITIQAPFRRAGLALRERRVQSSSIEPLVLAPFARAAPSLDVPAVRAEFDNGRSRYVSILRGVAFLERVRAVKHPDIAVGIRGCSADTTQQPVVRHGGEFGVYFENRQDRVCALRDGGPKPAEKGHECDRRQACAREDLLSHVTALPSIEKSSSSNVSSHRSQN